MLPPRHNGGINLHLLLCLKALSFFPSDMTQDEAYELMKKCVAEMKRRFIVNLPKFPVRLISKDGLKELPVIIAEGEAA